MLKFHRKSGEEYGGRLFNFHFWTKDNRKDHHAGHESKDGIENSNPKSRTQKRLMFWKVWTVDNHCSHSHGERKEGMAKGLENGVSCDFREVDVKKKVKRLWSAVLWNTHAHNDNNEKPKNWQKDLHCFFNSFCSFPNDESS